MISKKELRKEILKRRDALTVEERREKSHLIAEQVCQMKEFIEANKVLLFSSFRSEVNTAEIFEATVKADIEVYYPKVLGKEMEFYQIESEEDFEEGYWGIREPKVDADKNFIPQCNEKICVIMPGAVFDTEGNRIGYGGGYYDKYLNLLNEKVAKKNVATIAVAFECQLVNEGEILCGEHDIKPNYIVTESKIFQI